MQYNTIQYNTIQCNAIQYNTIQYNTIQYNTIQYNTIQYNTIQYNTTQYNTIQYNTIQHPGVIRAIFQFWEILSVPIRFELQNLYPRGEIFECDNKYIIKCLPLKYRLIFLLIFLYSTCPKAHTILSRLVKISACISTEGT